VNAFGDFSDFGEAAGEVMEMLHEFYGLDAWFVTRIRLDEWIVTHLRGRAPFERGSAIHVPAAMRMQMLHGQSARNPAENAMPAGEHAYVGAPLVVRDQLFGVLCGLDMSGSEGERRDFRHVMTAARILSTVLRSELEHEELMRRAERAESEALVDQLTGLFNRRGWDRLTQSEEMRAARYGHGATVFVMDVDGLKRKNDEEGHLAGDAMLRSVADALRSVIRENDIAARLGGDEFAVLAVEADGDEARALQDRLVRAFEAAGVRVSIGSASRGFGGLAEAVSRADAAMYEQKRGMPVRRRSSART
jgi:diguanylate cyclase